MGNLRSIKKAFDSLEVESIISSNYIDILKADKLVLPGVGFFKQGMENIKSRGLVEPLNNAVLEKKIPILGICLGMQLLTNYSEEGDCQGLGWVDSNTKKFSFENGGYKIPHIGWNNLITKKNSPLFNGINVDNYFYFVHSYFISCKNEEDILCETLYGHLFVSSFNKGNIYGTQFHPEKSHDAGLLLLKNFVVI